MATAHRRAEWDRTAWLCATLINSNPFREGPPVTPDQCNPMVPEDQQAKAPTRGVDCLDATSVSAYAAALKLREARRDG